MIIINFSTRVSSCRSVDQSSRFVSVIIALFIILSLKYLYKNWKSDELFLSLKNKRVIITGGSSGIGLSLAKLVYRYGAHVTIIARNVNGLKKAQDEISNQDCILQGEIKYHSIDLTLNYKTLESLLEPLKDQTDILINCAGGAISRTFYEMKPEDIEAQIRLNYLGAAQTTRILLPPMLESKGVHRVVFVSSMAGQVGIYGYAAYSASKFALRGFAECLRMEVSDHGISVTLAFPPDTQTPGFDMEQIGKPIITKKLSSAAGVVSPDHVAQSIMKSTLRGEFFSYVGFDGWLLTKLTQGMCLPESFIDFLALIILSPFYRLVAVGYGLWMRFITYKNL